MTATIPTPLRICRNHLVGLWRDRSGIAATEFAIIVPLMLVLFFGVVEFSTGVAVDRKVTLVARTLSDLVSQNQTVATSDFNGIFTAGTLVMSQYAQSPYSATTLVSTISELYVDPNTHAAKVEWSVGNNTTALTVGTHVVTLAQRGRLRRDTGRLEPDVVVAHRHHLRKGHAGEHAIALCRRMRATLEPLPRLFARAQRCVDLRPVYRQAVRA